MSGFSLTILQSSSPRMPGIMTSERMMSGYSLARQAIASCPSATSITRSWSSTMSNVFRSSGSFILSVSWLLLSDVPARCSRDDSCDTGSVTVVVRGNVTMKVVPLLSSEQKVIFPCSIFTMRCTCNSPNPVPSSCDCRAFSAL